jgi:hypothetical protein
LDESCSYGSPAAAAADCVIELTPRCAAASFDPHGEGKPCGPPCPFTQGRFCDNPWCAVESNEVKLPCSVTEHEKRLRRLVCCVSGQKSVTLHHCRGGSMAGSLFGTPGVGQKQNEALQIPLHHQMHVGTFGIDGRVAGGVQSWESKWGLQTEHLASTSLLLQYSMWSLAWLWASPLVRRRVERFLQQSRSRCHPQ